jgi:tRNA dimethylallyltransferase
VPEGVIPVIVVFGPTAVGKTAFLLNFSKISEIINIDSLQVYKYMNIGTAKPDPGISSRIKHHLVDIIEPDREFNTFDFVTGADKLSAEIYSDGKVPVISGGNAFFLRNFIYGLPSTPGSDANIRKIIETRLEKEGLESLFGELEKADPLYSAKISKNDKYRITRALEVYYASGRPLSDYSIPCRERDLYDFMLIGLIRDRKELYDRINKRVDRMFDEGLYDEFLRLRAMGYGAAAPGMSAIGYREFFNLDENPSLALDDIRNMIKQNTRHYAKRQITFFSKIDNVIWENPDNTDSILENISQFLGRYGKNL